MHFNTTTISTELVKICNEFIEEKFLHNLVSAAEFAILADESTDKATIAQMVTYVRYVDSITYEPKEKYVSIRKLGTTKTSKATMTVRNNVS